ncbi:MAG TPA: amino acid permease [Terriglobales bacterium]|nr:amino acid permease [Terriglobales bacterium]
MSTSQAPLPVSSIGNETGLRGQLTAGQMAMLAVGGSIGTGLLLGSGAAINIAGPAVVLSYVIGAAIAFTVTMALGEMASAHPAAGSFGVYAELYLNDWAGFVARYGYWFAVVIAVGGELVAAATYMRVWFPNTAPVVWIVVFAALLLVINLRPVKDYGTFEYWFAMVKVITIAAFILIGAALLLSKRAPAQYNVSGGFFPHGASSPLLAASFALFSFLGIEFVAIASGEAKSPASVARATRIMFALLALLYIGATAVLVGVMPWTQAGVVQSPFVTVFQIAGIPAASLLMNVVVLTAALSGANANIFAAGRMLFSLARSGYAPAALGRLTGGGSPHVALSLSAIGILVAILTQTYAPEGAYLYIIGASLFGGMLAWWITLAAHINFRKRFPADQLAQLPLHAPGGRVLSTFGFVALMAAIGSTWFVPQTRITVVSGPFYLLLLTIGYFFVRRAKQ